MRLRQFSVRWTQRTTKTLKGRTYIRGALTMIQPPPAAHDLTERIDPAPAEDAAASAQLNRRPNEIFRATAALVAELVEDRVGALVLAQPDRTAKLGTERVDKLKGDLASTLATMPVSSAKHLAAAFPWTFPKAPAEIGDRDRAPLYQGGSDLPWMLDDVVREMTAEAGRLARAAGFDIDPASHWDEGADGKVRRYLGPYVVAPRLTLALRGYSDARLRYFRMLRALRRLEAEKSARDARLEAEADRDSTLAPVRWLWTESAEAKH
jgi:hypothetical protein